MKEYITDKEFTTLLEDIAYKLSNDKLDECKKMLEQVISDNDNEEKYIDRTYIGNVKAKKRIMSRLQI